MTRTPASPNRRQLRGLGRRKLRAYVEGLGLRELNISSRAACAARPLRIIRANGPVSAPRRLRR
eukprot:1311133-Pyramimonas_sp.AAC.1